MKHRSNKETQSSTFVFGPVFHELKKKIGGFFFFKWIHKKKSLHKWALLLCQDNLFPQQVWHIKVQIKCVLKPLKLVTTAHCHQVKTPVRMMSMQIMFPETLSDGLCRNSSVLQTS